LYAPDSAAGLRLKKGEFGGLIFVKVGCGNEKARHPKMTRF
jgi:hypothetical protein